MTEIYRDTQAMIALQLPGATDVSAVVSRGGQNIYTTTGDSFYLPFSITGYDGPFTVTWSFTFDSATQNRSESHSIVTPYVPIDEIRDELEIPADITDSKLVRTERQVRKIIDRVTHTSFGKYVATQSILGKGDNLLALPDRLISLTGISGPYLVTDVTQYETRGDGRYLARSPEYPQGDWVFSNVIAAPDWAPNVYSVGPDWYSDEKWQSDIRYSVTGVWGWEDVPDAVREAALILIEQRLCPDSEYRDRYVDDTNYGDSSIGFDPRAFSTQSTGNVVADQLLAEFIRLPLTVI